ncbi:hypothetical protein CAEBREN_16847 [Caenorhabditis brenneri]|uniref:Uncharacterized protein n=1 Tax=Caenorhabditis brenneri TaxID=135651 RepID=G0NEV2_CAEBE|nr:hypothetical protein CAEBREN_16847 [Caenorhabditis brenneri]
MSRQSTLAQYGLDISITPISSDYEDSDNEDKENDDPTEKTMKPQELLQLAVKKRWELSKRCGENLRCELFQTRLIVNLAMHIEKSKKIFTFDQGPTAKPSPSVPAQEFKEPAPKRFKDGN